MLPCFVNRHAIDTGDFHWPHIVVRLIAGCVDKNVELVVQAVFGDHAITDDSLNTITNQFGLLIL